MSGTNTDSERAMLRHLQRQEAIRDLSALSRDLSALIERMRSNLAYIEHDRKCFDSDERDLFWNAGLKIAGSKDHVAELLLMLGWTDSEGGVF